MKDHAWQAFLELLAVQQDLAELRSVLNTLLTAEERDAISNRLSTFRALLSGQETQREISARLGVSIATVTRCSNNIKNLSSTEKSIIQ